MEKRGKHHFKVGLEIFLLVTMSFAISFELRESFKTTQPIIVDSSSENFGDLFMGIYKAIVDFVFGDRNFVSAANSVTYTCIKSKTGSLCQEYPVLSQVDVQYCNNLCNETCVPAARKDVAQCKLGTCFDPVEGVCTTNSPRKQCTDFGGSWFDDPNGNIVQCKKGCCVLGDEAAFVTEQQCKNIIAKSGNPGTFKGEVRTELECVMAAKVQIEGACVFEKDFEKNCKFTTKAACLQTGGTFKEGYLCSNPELNVTKCTKEAKTGCVSGKDEIYWFDSCNNRENIYDANAVKSWNGGKVLPKNDSCAMGPTAGSLLNQKTCGNCNYLLGTKCGAKTATQALSDTNQKFVCKDLGCVDKSGKKRKNGESWCEYDSAIGVDETKNRAMDVPGSRHFRAVCSNGEVRIEPCADYRNAICVEEQTDTVSGKLSSAACKLNQWQVCLNYNTEDSSGSSSSSQEETEARIGDKCNENEDCYIKKTEISSNFKFNFCMPKYPPGFDIAGNGEGAQRVCSFANQKCTVVYVKTWGGWSCKANCECATKVFSEKMNDFCMSLGDCGAKVNYVGALSESYRVTSSEGTPQKLDAAYKSGITAYAKPIVGRYANTTRNITEFLEQIGIPEEGLGNADESSAKGTDLGMAGMIAGVGGIALLWAASAYPVTFAFLGATAATPGLFGTSLGATSGSIGAGAGALAGAAIGFAVVALLLQYTGVGRGLGAGASYALMAAGAISGAIIGANLAAAGTSTAATATTASSTAGLGFLGAAGATVLVIAWVVLIAVVVFILVSFLMGIGKIKKVTYTFKCNPWEAPTGGDKCNQCGKNGLPCSSYTCSALGQTCQFINEGTKDEACVDIGPNDPTKPILTPNPSVLYPGYNYTNISAYGYKVTGPEGCLKSYAPVVFGFDVNKVSQCRLDVKHTSSFDEMSSDFGGSSLFKYNHTMTMTIPSIESLGIPGYDPNSQTDFNLYVRCQDKRGNKNDAEYVVNFCVKPGNDKTPPRIVDRVPVSPYVAWNVTSVDGSVFVNEPAECRWSYMDQDYETMTKNMSCNNQIEQMEMLGWRCRDNFGVSGNTTNVFIRCKDQPGLISVNENTSMIVVDDGVDEFGNNITRNVTINEARQRNVNTQSYTYVITRSLSALDISSLSPDNITISVGTEPTTVTLSATTVGGVDGSSNCEYSWGGQYIPFAENFATTHTQVFQAFFSGTYNMNVRCKDDAGNTAEKTARFKVEIDRSPPVVTRVFRSGDSFNVITNEPSRCAFVTSGDAGYECSFNFDNATQMSNSGVSHSGPFNQRLSHYVKCRDQWNNTAGGCDIIVKGGISVVPKQL